MNTLRNSKTWLSFVLMLVVLCHFNVGHSDASAYVLCFGADGHVAVEHTGHDHGVYSTKVEASAYFTDIDSPCTDIPVVGDDHSAHIPLIDLSKTPIDFGLLPLFFLVFFLKPYARVILQRHFFSDPLFTDSRLLSLRSTVILI